LPRNECAESSSFYAVDGAPQQLVAFAITFVLVALLLGIAELAL